MAQTTNSGESAAFDAWEKDAAERAKQTPQNWSIERRAELRDHQQRIGRHAVDAVQCRARWKAILRHGCGRDRYTGKSKTTRRAPG